MRGAVSVAIDPVVSGDDGPVVVEQPPALKAAKTATEARRPRGWTLHRAQALDGKRDGRRRRTSAEQ